MFLSVNQLRQSSGVWDEPIAGCRLADAQGAEVYGGQQICSGTAIRTRGKLRARVH